MAGQAEHKDYDGHGIPALLVGSKLQDPLTVSSVSIQSNAVSAVGESGTRIVTLYYKSTDDECHFVAGLDPTATTNDEPLPSRVATAVTIKDGDKLAFIQNSTDNAVSGASGGSLFITQI